MICKYLGHYDVIMDQIWGNLRKFYESSNFSEFGPWWRHNDHNFWKSSNFKITIVLGPKITFVYKFSNPYDKYYLIHQIYPNLPKFGPWWLHNDQDFWNSSNFKIIILFRTFVYKFSKPYDKYYLIHQIYPNLLKFPQIWSMMTS